MKKCYIFAGGEFDGFFDQVKKGDYIIGADKGYTYIEKIGLRPHIIIGDFDSAKKPDFENKIVLKPEKDETDLYAAINIGIKKGYKKIIVYGALGGRISHTIANIKILEDFKKKGIDIELKNKNQRLFVIDKNFIEKKQIENTYVSLFALTEKVENLSLINLKYQLKNYTLENHMHIGVSNEPIGKEFKIEFDKGMVLVIYENKNSYK
ncbi:thiamine diphosphokinase [Anaerococcus hydrogenalis]|uniref:thiamine diphosphokinase n=1 Tax=Anaerococcus hydrogenalis TaxID=33029 RepID=UPI0023F0595B|nr:thiamine diphosphokinase [Anaerococcus hydrogenalis]